MHITFLQKLILFSLFCKLIISICLILTPRVLRIPNSGLLHERTSVNGDNLAHVQIYDIIGNCIYVRTYVH